MMRETGRRAEVFVTALWLYRVVVASLVGALVYDVYTADALGGYSFDGPVQMVVILAALAEPAFWALTHLFGGVLMGCAAGGIWDGLKLSMILGLGLGVSRSWPYVAAATAGVYAGGGPLLYSIGGGILAVGLFALDKAMTWMWHQARPEHM